MTSAGVGPVYRFLVYVVQFTDLYPATNIRVALWSRKILKIKIHYTKILVGYILVSQKGLCFMELVW